MKLADLTPPLPLPFLNQGPLGYQVNISQACLQEYML